MTKLPLFYISADRALADLQLRAIEETFPNIRWPTCARTGRPLMMQLPTPYFKNHPWILQVSEDLNDNRWWGWISWDTNGRDYIKKSLAPIELWYMEPNGDWEEAYYG